MDEYVFPPPVDSLDYVYEALTVDNFEYTHQSIFVDCAVATPQNNLLLEEELRRLLSENLSVGSVVVWSDVLTAELVSSISSRKIDVIKINPQWHRPAYMLALFGSVTHCVFVDTQRVVDAIVTRIPCTLIAGAGFSASLKTRALQRTVMDSEICKVYWDENRNNQEDTDYSVVDNRVVDLHSALRDCTGVQAESVDWLSAARRSDGEVVITAYPLQWLEAVSSFQDRRIILRKKWQKLREDPRGFCVDSKQPGLRFISKILPHRPLAR